MKDTRRLEALLQDIIRDCRFRAPSLIITFLGDFIAPHGGSFWIGSLIEMMAPLGVNERLVRTATFRLTKENWLSSEQIGRRSYYSLTRNSVKSFEEAFRRVYTSSEKLWDGQWCLVFLNGGDLSGDERDQARAELAWLGFGMVSPNVFAHPTMNALTVRDKLAAFGMADKAMLMRGKIDPLNEASATSDFIQKCWDIDKLASDYTLFLNRFRPLMRMVGDQPPAAPLSFLIRLIVIHEYRRLTLRDPQLPPELLPPDWAGSAARTFSRNLYRLVSPKAEDYLLAHVETASGPLPAAGPQYHNRFSGPD